MLCLAQEGRGKSPAGKTSLNLLKVILLKNIKSCISQKNLEPGYVFKILKLFCMVGLWFFRYPCMFSVVPEVHLLMENVKTHCHSFMPHPKSLFQKSAV